MEILIDGLDGDRTTVSPPCLPPLKTGFSQVLIEEAERFLRKDGVDIQPRR